MATEALTNRQLADRAQPDDTPCRETIICVLDTPENAKRFVTAVGHPKVYASGTGVWMANSPPDEENRVSREAQMFFAGMQCGIDAAKAVYSPLKGGDAE